MQHSIVLMGSSSRVSQKWRIFGELRNITKILIIIMRLILRLGRQIDKQTHRANGKRRVVLEFSTGHFAADSAGSGASEVTTWGRVMVRQCTGLVHGQTKEVLLMEFNSKCRKYNSNLKQINKYKMNIIFIELKMFYIFIFTNHCRQHNPQSAQIKLWVR